MNKFCTSFIILISTFITVHKLAHATDIPDWNQYQWSDFKDIYMENPACSKQEITLWSCNTAKKSYNLCASRELAKDSGYIQYRVSKAGKTIFKYPEKITPPISSFQFISSPNGDASIEFKNGAYEYVLFDTLRGQSSIVVSSINTKTTIECDNNNSTLQLNYSLKLMHNSGIWVNE